MDERMFQSLGPGHVGIDLAFPEAAELAATTGFEGIQVDLGYLRENGPDAYRTVLSDNDLRTGSMGLPVSFRGDAEAYEADVEALPEIAEMAAAIGCDRCSTWILPFSDEQPFEERFELLRDRLTEPASILDDHGIRLGLEFVGPKTLREGHEYEFVHTIDGMLDLCSAIGTGNVGLLLDSYHWYTSGSDVEALESLTYDDVVDVHVNDAPKGRSRSEQLDGERCLPGETGVIDIATFLGHLDRIGYDGPVTVEPFDDELADRPADEAARATKESLDRIWETAGL